MIPSYVEIIKLTNSKKKYKAIFYDKNKNKIKTTSFGASGYSDYTIHKDPARKSRYIARHKHNEDWNDPMRSGTLSRYILWNLPSFNASVKDYKKRFGLKGL